MAIVLDNGRAVGLITLEDILEEIIGKIEDEYPRSARSWCCSSARDPRGG